MLNINAQYKNFSNYNKNYNKYSYNTGFHKKIIKDEIYELFRYVK